MEKLKHTKNKYGYEDLELILVERNYVLRMDGVSFKFFRAPHINMDQLKSYNLVLEQVVLETKSRFETIDKALAVDDEFYFSFTPTLDCKDGFRGFKLISKITSFVTTRFNHHVSKLGWDSLNNKLGGFYFDFRLVLVEEDDIDDYFKKVSNKVFVNQIRAFKNDTIKGVHEINMKSFNEDFSLFKGVFK